MRTTIVTLAAQEHGGCLGAAARDALASTTQTVAPLPQPITTPDEAQG